ncbi:uncharacterized protein PRCAT00004699001 [Priceomyces carsonii]|uniref:uncharacterized protein n=1 Tax=Priceomyces carsonii TaxID=28549 RepID=UPI002EDA358D|nr:unnamed protein product [Priceomyces carsonii]
MPLTMNTDTDNSIFDHPHIFPIGQSHHNFHPYLNNGLSYGNSTGSVRSNSLISTGSNFSELDLLPELWRAESDELNITQNSLLPPIFKSSDIWNPEPTKWLPNDLLELPQPAFGEPDIFNLELQQVPQQTKSLKKPLCPLKQRQNLNTNLYKTELCASYTKLGVCPYGGKCQFAHGDEELKKVDRPPKWRSKPCANWAKYGNCRYGNRCCFKHSN